jgi:DNA-binding winged helix-turn-helix (wHTH) protein/Flp pilus assembly protein TadD
MSDLERGDARVERIALADRNGFSIGQTAIDPPLRTIRAVDSATVEPRVMQVLVALHDAGGNVVSRERLIDLCWGGVIVGDDAINRAIAELRRAAIRAGADFEVETIPKIGYRLKSGAEPDDAQALQPGGLARRHVLAGGALAATGLGGFIWLRPEPRDNATRQLLAEARGALRSELPPDNKRAVDLLERATRQAPQDAETAGLLAIALRNATEFAPSDQVSQTVRRTELAAQRALQLDPAEGHALTAIATLKPYMGDWIASERSLLEVLESAPNTIPAISHLTTLYQSSGLLRRSKQFNDRALALDSLSPVFQFRGALKHWIFGQVAEADLMIDRVLQVWPRHPAVWNARMMLFAFTGRAQSALALLDNRKLGPQSAPKPLFDLWRVSLMAIADRSQASIDRAVAANLGAVRKTEGQAVVSMMTLSTLGRVDEAFEVANGYFLGQGSAVSPAFADRQIQLADHMWKRSMMLFTPATLAMRQDPRFAGLCDSMGLTRFWAEADHAPDYREFDRPGPG